MMEVASTLSGLANLIWELNIPGVFIATVTDLNVLNLLLLFLARLDDFDDFADSLSSAIVPNTSEPTNEQLLSIFIYFQMNNLSTFLASNYSTKSIHISMKISAFTYKTQRLDFSKLINFFVAKSMNTSAEKTRTRKTHWIGMDCMDYNKIQNKKFSTFIWA